MNDSQMSWEKELLHSPHPTKGFSIELKNDIERKSKLPQRRFYSRTRYLRVMGLLMSLVLLLLAAPANFSPQYEQRNSIRKLLEEPLFYTSLQSLIKLHQFPQDISTFKEVSHPDKSGEYILFSEVTRGEVSQQQIVKVSYRIKIVESTQQGMPNVQTVEFMKDWNTRLGETDQISRWIYQINGENIQLLSEEDAYSSPETTITGGKK